MLGKIATTGRKRKNARRKKTAEHTMRIIKYWMRSVEERAKMLGSSTDGPRPTLLRKLVTPPETTSIASPPHPRAESPADAESCPVAVDAESFADGLVFVSRGGGCV